MKEPRRDLRVPLLPALVLIAGACGGEVRPTTRSTVRDSAGIEIVENRAPAWGPGEAWTLSAGPVLSIGAVEGEYPYIFSRIVGAQRLSDGRIVIADLASQELRFFDSRGRSLSIAGGKGEGPGEFTSMSSFWRGPADSLIVSAMRGLVVLDPEGAYARLIPRPPPGEELSPQLVAYEDGKILGRASTRPAAAPAPNSVRRDTVVFLRFEPDGTSGEVLARMPQARLWITDPGSFMRRVVPFSAHATAAAAGDRFYLTGGTEAEIEVWGERSTPDRIIRWPEPEPVTPELLARNREFMLESAGSLAERRAVEAFLDLVVVPERVPAIGELPLQADGEGTLWVPAYRLPWEEDEVRQEWSVFSPGGRWLGSIRTPPRFTLTEVGRDFVLGSWRDELDVEHVVMYEVIRPAEVAQ